MYTTKRVKLKRIVGILILLVSILAFKPILSTVYIFPYRDLTFYYANINSVDPYLLAALIKTESNFNTLAESHKGARGLMQVMPETADWVATHMNINNFAPDLLYEPETNLKIGTWYLAYLNKEFNNEVTLVLAAYNGGSGNVKKWLAEKKISGGNNSIDKIPFMETREFVGKVLWTRKIYKFLYK